MKYKFDNANHVHLLDGTPLYGTTTVLGILSKPLTWWASGMACAEFGWLDPKKNTKEDIEEKAISALAWIRVMEVPEYQKLLNKAYRAHHENKEKTADQGIDLHQMIEDFIKGEMTGTGTLTKEPIIEPFVEWSRLNVKKFLFSEMCCYSQEMWVGGIADFGYVDMEGNNVLGDIKSSKEAYFSQGVQLGAYDLQIAKNGGFTEDGEKVFTLDKPFKYHAIFAARAGIGKPFYNYNTESAKNAFVHALELYKEDSRFPGFEREPRKAI